MDFGARAWNAQTEYRNKLIHGVQEKQGMSSNFGNLANSLSPAILVDDIQLNFSTSFECSIARCCFGGGAISFGKH
jgi:hypothetical protein